MRTSREIMELSRCWKKTGLDTTEHTRQINIASSWLLNRVLENIVREYIASSLLGKLDDNYIEDLIDRAFESGIIMPLEERYRYDLVKVDPLKLLKDKAIVGVDGGAFSVKLHPMRIFLVRSAVFFHSQRPDFDYDLQGVWRTSIFILKNSGNIEEELRRKLREHLIDVEAATVRELAEEFGGHIDAVFWDGPLYLPRKLNKFYAPIRALTNRAIICVKSVKNSFVSRISKVANTSGITDADLFVIYLRPNQRSGVFIYDSGFASKLPEDMKPVFFYLKSQQRVMLRYEFPYWVVEEYGLRYVLKLIYSDLALGNGISYVTSRADKLARFSDQEKRYILYRILTTLKKNGVDETILFNERRWTKFLSEGIKWV